MKGPTNKVKLIVLYKGGVCELESFDRRGGVVGIVNSDGTFIGDVPIEHVEFKIVEEVQL